MDPDLQSFTGPHTIPVRDGLTIGEFGRLVAAERKIPVSRSVLALAREIRVRHRDQFRPESIQNLLVNRSTMWAFLSGESFDRLVAWADTDRNSFLNRRASYLMYR